MTILTDLSRATQKTGRRRARPDRGAQRKRRSRPGHRASGFSDRLQLETTDRIRRDLDVLLVRRVNHPEFSVVLDGVGILETMRTLRAAHVTQRRPVFPQCQRLRKRPSVATEGDRQRIAVIRAGRLRIADQVVPAVGQPARHVLAHRVGVVGLHRNRPGAPRVEADRMIKPARVALVADDQVQRALRINVGAGLAQPVVGERTGHPGDVPAVRAGR